MTREEWNALQVGDLVRPYSGGKHYYQVLAVNRSGFTGPGNVDSIDTQSDTGRKRNWFPWHFPRLTKIAPVASCD